MAGPAFVLQTEEKVPEVDSSDALSSELPGAGATGHSRLRRTRSRALCTRALNGRVHFPLLSGANGCQRRQVGFSLPDLSQLLLLHLEHKTVIHT